MKFNRDAAHGFTYTIQPVQQEFMTPLANSDAFDNRLVTRYPFFEWSKRDCPVPGEALSANAKLAIKQITYGLKDMGQLSETISKPNPAKGSTEVSSTYLIALISALLIFLILGQAWRYFNKEKATASKIKKIN